MPSLRGWGDDDWRLDGVAADELIQAAEAAADTARAVVKPLFRVPLTTQAKDDQSPVTIADHEAEAAIRSVLSARFPTFGLQGEEFGLERPEARFRWVVDPIDGTRAFITGRPTFGTLVALLDRGDPILGVIDQPITGERWIGFRGRPTTFSGSFGGRAGARKCSGLRFAELSCTAPDMLDACDRSRWDQLAAHVRRTSWGGDCYAYGLLAIGQIDIVAEAGLKLWDWAALQPIIEGVGGRITDWNGKPLSATSDGKVLAAGDPAVHALATECLRVQVAASGAA
jgi:myo-inositol-1(or 4)-monophosphatase